MFKFTIRDLFLVTVIVGLGLGWFLRERHLAAKMAATAGQANVLEYLLTQERLTVAWNEDRTIVTVYRAGNDDDGRAMYVPAFTTRRGWPP